MSELISLKSIWILRLQMISRRYWVYSLLCYVLEVLIFLSCISPGNQLLFFILFFLLRNFLPSLFSLNKIPLPLDNYFIVVFYVNFAINAWIIFLLKKIISEYFFWDDFFYLFGTYTLNMLNCLVFYHIVS